MGIAAMAISLDTSDGRPMDSVIAALEALDAVLVANERRSAAMRERIELIRAAREQGSGYAEIVAGEERPLIVEMLTESAQSLDAVGAEVRRSGARALHRDGLTMEQIAEHFGVSRQRIGALLREARHAGR